jgi:Flp pilus assembly protein TadG
LVRPIAALVLETDMRRLLNRFRRKLLGPLLKSEDGAAAIEFVFVVFPFIYVLGCITETGVMLFTEYVLQSSVQDASRQIRTGGAQGASLDAAGFKSKVCQNIGILVNCGSKVTVYVKPATSFSSLKSSLPGGAMSVGTEAGSPQSFNCGQASQPGTVIATYDWTFTFPFMNFLGNINGNTQRRLTAVAIYQNEPYPGTSSCS